MSQRQQDNIHALHGFLGQSSDWSDLGILNERLTALNLFADFPILSFNDWAKTFNQQVREKAQESRGNILMGYSLGGRLGLHVVLEDPKLWKAAIFISTHPGLKSQDERQLRISADEAWAKRFENEAWDPLMQAWNSQGVFNHDSFSFKREEKDYNRRVLSQALKTWSLGKQEDLSEHLNALEIPVLWMVGADDAKFLQKAKELTFKNTRSKLCVVPEAGHRLPWQQTETFLLNLTKFIQSLEQVK